MSTENRAIEFRVFHHPTGQLFAVWMFNEVEVWAKTNEAAQGIETSTVSTVSFPRQECVIMQNTGVHDLLGAVIWEGDVLRADYLFGPIKSRDVDHSRYYYVTFYNGGFCFVPVGDTDLDATDPFQFSEYGKSKIQDVVIGNVYQHRHLLDLIGEQPLASNSPV